MPAVLILLLFLLAGHARGTFDPCSPSPCLNDGACVPIDDVASCACTQGYTGEVCEIANCEAVLPPLLQPWGVLSTTFCNATLSLQRDANGDVSLDIVAFAGNARLVLLHTASMPLAF